MRHRFSTISTYTLAVCGLIYCSGATAASSQQATYARIQQQINRLQAELNTLKASMPHTQLASANSHTKTSQHANTNQTTLPAPAKPIAPNPPPHLPMCGDHPCIYNQSQITIGSYINKDMAIDGSELLVNLSSNREDARLLLRHAQINQEAKELGIPAPPNPRIAFSGYLEGAILFDQKDGFNQHNPDFKFSGGEWDTGVRANDWVAGYTALQYDDSNAAVEFNRAFIMIGDLAKMPIYMSIGQLYMPFGRYSSFMYNSPSTQVLGRTLGDGLVLGYEPISKIRPHAEIYGYTSPRSNFSDGQSHPEYGADLGVEFDTSPISGEIGASYISNLADSQGYQASLFNPDFLIDPNDNYLLHNAAGYGAYATLGIHAFTFIAEYVQQADGLQVDNTTPAENPNGIKPSALHFEASYSFHIKRHPSSFSLIYGHTEQATLLALPQDRYGAIFNTSLWRHTQFTLEYLHNEFYNGTATEYTKNAGIVLNGKENLVSAAIDLYF